MPVDSASTRFGDVRRFDSVTSTNSVAADLLRAGAGPGLVVVADHQTAGRGRLDRKWEAPPGSSLLVSVVLAKAWLWEGRLPLASLAMALAASDACGETTGLLVRIKWPNDLVVGSGMRKVGGILSEVVAVGSSVVVGLGVNVRWGDVAPPASGVALDALGASTEPPAVLAALLRHLDGRLEDSVERLLDGYRARSATLGQEVRVDLGPAGSLTGAAVDITAYGHLVVDGPDGNRHTVVAGDVITLRPAGAS